MKRMITPILFLFFIGSAFSQAPQVIKYQAVARSIDGDPLINQDISVKISILAGTLAGVVIYSEQHYVETSGMGLFSLGIGNPNSVLSGTFEDISWSTSDYFLKLEMDQNGGTNYQDMGTSQLLSVPYALNSSSLTLTNENGNKYNVTVDTSGNLITTLIEEEFFCGNPFTDQRDGNVYNTVQIGDQCWMVENLNTGTMINSITGGTNNDGEQTDNDILEKNCFNNTENNCAFYGGLYQWNETMQYVTTEGTQGICPAGWHVPKMDEWSILIAFIGGFASPKGNELKSCRQHGSPLGGECDTSEHPRWDYNLTDYGTDNYGFTAFPGGVRNVIGNFNDFTSLGNWWTSSESSNPAYSWRYLLTSNDGKVHWNEASKQSGIAVRCLKDN